MKFSEFVMDEYRLNGSEVRIPANTVLEGDALVSPPPMLNIVGEPGHVITGMTQIYNAYGSHLVNLMFIDRGEVEMGAQLQMLGGRNWKIEECEVEGGRCAGQLAVSLNQNQKYLADKVPRDWIIAGTSVSHHGGMWREYHQPHNFYNLADPGINQNGLVTGCSFAMENGLGASVKIGGTGGNPRFEGSRGVRFVGCDVQAGLGPEADALGILVQGAKSEAIFQDCRVRTIGGGMRTRVSVKDGARCRMDGVDFMDGVFQDVEWYELWGLWRRQKACVGPVNVGGLSWAK